MHMLLFNLPMSTNLKYIKILTSEIISIHQSLDCKHHLASQNAMNLHLIISGIPANIHHNLFKKTDVVSRNGLLTCCNPIPQEISSVIALTSFLPHDEVN